MIELRQNEADQRVIKQHLEACDKEFAVALSERLDVMQYADKIVMAAERVEAWQADQLVGLVAYYENERSAFITNVSVDPRVTGQGIGQRLVQLCLDNCRAKGIKEVSLEVHPESSAALRIYAKLGFQATLETEQALQMTVNL